MIDRPRNMEPAPRGTLAEAPLSDPTPGDALKAETLARTGSRRRAAAPRGLEDDRPQVWHFARRGRLKAALSVADQAIVSGTSFVTAVIRHLLGRRAGTSLSDLSIALILIGLQQNVISAPFILLCSRRKGQDLGRYTGSTGFITWR